MALVECPECKKMISDKANACPNCGFPLNKTIGDDNIDKDAIAILHSNGTIAFMKKIGEIHNFQSISEVIHYIDTTPNLKHEYDLAVLKNKENPNSKAVPKCPTCGSVNIKKISATKKAASIIGLGILSSNLGKTFQCLNCKYKW